RLESRVPDVAAFGTAAEREGAARDRFRGPAVGGQQVLVDRHARPVQEGPRRRGTTQEAVKARAHRPTPATLTAAGSAGPGSKTPSAGATRRSEPVNKRVRLVL